MSTYIKGPICGVDNCRSRLWRIIDGRRTCQYGHVMEGDVEFNDDEDDVNAMGVVTRRLNLTTNATGNFQSSLSLSQSQRSTLGSNKTEKIYGKDGRLLFIKCFQYILRKQTEWLIEKENFPNSYSDLVKLIWTMHLKHIDPVLFADNNNDRLNGHDSDEAGDDDDGNNYPVSGKRNEVGRLKLSMLSSISIHYLACLHLGLPIFTNDILRWICVDGLPYFRSHHILPKEWQDKLPNYYLLILDGGKPPCELQLQHKVAQCAQIINFKTHFRSVIPAPVLLLRLTLIERLPGEFYFYSKRLLHLLYDNLEIPILTYEDNHYRRPHQYTDIKICSVFIAAVKLQLLTDQQSKADNFDANFASGWLNMMKRTDENPKDKFSKAKLIFKMTYSPASSLVDSNSEIQSAANTTQYLDWIEKNLLSLEETHLESTQTLDEKIANRKLHNIIPLKASPDPSSGDIALIEDIQSGLLEFQSLYDRNANPGNYYSIFEMVDKITRDLSLHFGISHDQLRASTEHIIQNIEETM